MCGPQSRSDDSLEDLALATCVSAVYFITHTWITTQCVSFCCYIDMAVSKS